MLKSYVATSFDLVFSGKGSSFSGGATSSIGSIDFEEGPTSSISWGSYLSDNCLLYLFSDSFLLSILSFIGRFVASAKGISEILHSDLNFFLDSSLLSLGIFSSFLLSFLELDLSGLMFIFSLSLKGNPRGSESAGWTFSTEWFFFSCKTSGEWGTIATYWEFSQPIWWALLKDSIIEGLKY